MKNTKLEIVRNLLAGNINKSNKKLLSNGDENVNSTERKPKRYKQYF